ncbi:MAG: bifunctional heptose 7-phosphate kinase/heptose 1-phosphate adenyltransferase, partial [Chthoniobacterales bacterium]|nr:bifunctional heptose 7-phosphate kinase/heptose 1-phosphate adenyltransferase [Chthoniobacterales bacterium]
MSTPLIELVENLPKCRVVLVGDFMVDKYIFGATDRVSPEAPIPILRFTREEYRLGGAGFVLAGLCELGAEVRAVGIVGNDEAGKVLCERMTAAGADCSGLVPTENRCTVTKTRLLGSSEDKSPQQMIRLDMEDASPVDAPTGERLVAAAIAAMDGANVVAIEDYNKGVVTPEVCRKVIAAARARGLPVLIDPARLAAADYVKYTGATALKLNRPEVERATGMLARSRDQLQAAADALLTKLDLEAVVLTLNDAGSYLATRAGVQELLAGRKRQVADATGAGDMVLVMLCLARAAGAEWSDAVALANTAGGLEV